MRRSVVFAALLLPAADAGFALADVLRVDLPQLEATYSYGHSSAFVPLDLGTALGDLSSIRLELTGVNTMGWWVGDGVEDTYVGPRGGYLSATLDSMSPDSRQWKASYHGTQDGPFIASICLYRAGDASDYRFLAGDATDLTLTNEYLAGWGNFAETPSFSLSHVELVVDTTPLPESRPLVSLGIGAAGLLAHNRRRRNQTR